MKRGYLRGGTDDEQGKEREIRMGKHGRQKSVRKKAWVRRENRRQRRSGSVKSYCTKSISGAHYGKHIKSYARCNCRKFTMTGGVVQGGTYTREAGLHCRSGSKRGDGKLLSDEYVCACMCTRVELRVTGSRHEGKCRLSPTL